MEKPADGTRGFLIRTFDDKTGAMEMYFRIYWGANGNFTDYNINHDDLEVEILDDFASFYDAPGQEPTLDYDSRTLGRTSDGNGKQKK